MSYLKDKKPVLGFRDRGRLDEGFGAIYHNHYYGQNAAHNGPAPVEVEIKNLTHDQPRSGVDSPEAGDKTRPGVGEATRMRNWHDKQMQDVASMRSAYGGGREAGTQRFSEGDRVETHSPMVFSEAVVPALVKGKVTEVSEDGVPTIDFGKWGTYAVPGKVASATLTVQQEDRTRSMLRESIGWTPESGFEIGTRVKDEGGRQYTVERTDTHNQVAQVMDENGLQFMLSTDGLTQMDEGESFAVHEGYNQSDPMNPGQFVTVTSVDPVCNSWRTRAVPANEAEGYIGQRGLLEFAFYHTGAARMYRVLFQNGARRDFGETELGPAEG
jgi:hypothetical protein